MSAPPRAAAWPAALAVFALGLAVAPRVYHNYDVVDCFLAWARATEGVRPWGVYTPGVGADDCDYPPLVPYLLTLVEAGRRASGAAEVSALAVALLKLPNMLAHLLATGLLLRGLRPVLGAQAARRAALLFALSPAFFVNTALWGQFDVLLALFVLGAVLALLRERPVWAGIWMGLALGTKLLAIVPVPLMAVWALRRFGTRALVAGAGAGLAVMALLALPHLLAGKGGAVAASYVGAINYYPYRTAEAYNTWYLLDRYDVLVRGIPPPIARRDDRPALGPATYRHVGLAAFALYTLVLTGIVARRPTRERLLWALALHMFGFFMIPTQVHQRYVVPVVALFALLAPASRGAVWLFAALTLTATANQALDLVRALPWQQVIDGSLTTAQLPLATRTARDLGAAIAAVNVALFAAAFWAFRRATAREAAEA